MIICIFYNKKKTLYIIFIFLCKYDNSLSIYLYLDSYIYKIYEQI